ncbi:MAG TPA: hypothetical protein VFK36_12180 [Gemmatimonadales bacterium]|nr:hypothetical protein [Gemmatimonadales bacterium]
MRPTLLALAVTLLAAVPLSAQIAPPMDSLELGRKASDWFFHGQSDSLWAHVADTTAWKSKAEFADELKSSLAQLVSRAGFEVKLLKEEFVKRHGQTQYWRTGQYTTFDDPVMIRWVIVGGRIAGFGMNPADQAPARDPS